MPFQLSILFSGFFFFIWRNGRVFLLDYTNWVLNPMKLFRLLLNHFSKNKKGLYYKILILVSSNSLPKEPACPLKDQNLVSVLVKIANRVMKIGGVLSLDFVFSRNEIFTLVYILILI